MGEESGSSHTKTLSNRHRNAKSESNKDPSTTLSDNFNIFSLPNDLSLKLSDVEDDEVESLMAPSVENEELESEIRDENYRLRKMLSEKELEIKQLKKKCNESAHTSINLPSDVAAIKIVELSRKIRDMTVELEKEKTKNMQMQRNIRDLENRARVDGSSLPKPETERESKSEVNSELQEKLNISNLKLSECRNTCQALKKDLKMAHKVLLQEVGDGVAMQAALSGSGWRGRAQQIISLQNKITELKEQLEKRKSNNAGDELKTFQVTSTTGTVDTKHRDNIKRLEKDRKDENEKLLENLKLYESEQQQLKEKLLATKSRIHILNNENQKLKAQISALITKGEHDDELIRAYTEQMSVLKNAQKQLHSFQENEHDINRVRKEHLEEIEKLRKVISDREEQIVNLQDEFRNKRTQSRRSVVSLSPQGPSSAPVIRSIGNYMDTSPLSRRGFRSSDALSESRNGILPELNATDDPPNEIEELHVMCHEYRTVAQAAQVEKEKLLELVTVLNKRVDEAIARALAAEERIHEIQLKNVQLEKQSEKASLEASGRGGKRSTLTTLRTASEYNPTVIELKSNIRVLEEEKETLQNTLQNLLKAKEDDLKIYQEIISHAQDIFTKGLHKHNDR